MSEKIVPVRTYILVFAALMVLTGTTCAVSFIDLGPFNAIVALLIAGLKASMVALFFMHVKYGPRLNKLVLVGSLFWLVILLSLTISDYLTRGLRYPGNG
ncbi:MAG TPA: cytochrome C oxidase subunit IV family protein [Blastocatellia bacterium]|nr:cytochrome C oxidase subunit IV family protein [Blastocatellia bacterium]